MMNNENTCQDELKVSKEVNIDLMQRLESKNKEIEKLNKNLDDKNKEYNKLKEEYNVLLTQETHEVLWTLKYTYSVGGVVKKFEQNGMLKEDAEELIGMDSDNWIHWSLTKEERPSKDSIIEGLIIRLDSEKEINYKLQLENDKLQKELFELRGNKDEEENITE